MLTQSLFILTITAFLVAFSHTLLGPDHYLPFVAMSRSGKWSLNKTVWVTIFCGLGHILSSILLGFIGIALGINVTKVQRVESVRGNLAAWGLIAFGLVYFVWGLRKALRNRPHRHWHTHANKGNHIHRHIHTGEHLHLHDEQGKGFIKSSPWFLFTLFVFGPCEPLIPLLMYPAAKNSLTGLILVSAIFGGVTILTMLTIVLFFSQGINFLPAKKLERYNHALAGAAICLCGAAINFLGL